MRSKNDYLDYLEHRIAEENYLAHHGVKGMKWHKRKKVKYDDQLHDPKIVDNAARKAERERRMNVSEQNDPKIQANSRRRVTSAVEKTNKSVTRALDVVSGSVKQTNRNIRTKSRMDASERNDPKMSNNAARKAARKRRMKISEANDYKLRNNKRRKVQRQGRMNISERNDMKMNRR